MPAVIKHERGFQKEKVREVFQKLIDAHEILRTEFEMEKGEPVQRIRAEVELEINECRVKGEAERQHVYQEFVRPFDLSKAPLIRMMLLEEGAEQELLIDMHHIIGDEISIQRMKEAFLALYEGGREPSVRLQYKDYSEWMRKRDLGQQKEYWKKEYEEEVPKLDLPTDYVRPQHQSYAGDVVRGKLPEEVREKVREAAQELEMTEYMLYLSGLMILLGKYSGQEDVVIGSPVAGRMHKETEEMLGMFVNTLALRGRPERKKRIGEFLQEVKESCLNAYENQEYPFEELVEEVQVQRDPARNPLFDVMLSMQNQEKEGSTVLSEKKEWLTGRMAKFDLTMNLCEAEEGCEIELEYASDLYQKEFIEGLLQHYETILSVICEEREKQIEEIETATQEERERLLEEFNDTREEYDREKTVIELFEEQVRRAPERIALEYYEERVTYGELNARANQIAYRLRKMGIVRGDFVGILAQRSTQMIAGIYGILKAGAAYVPLDPEYPEERIQYMLSDAKPKAILLYQSKVETKLPIIDLAILNEWPETTQDLPIVNQPNDLAYIIYTSGTTGNPKGVIIEHNGLHNLMIAYSKIYRLTAKDVVLSVANYIFDQSVWDIFNILLVGGRLCLISYYDIRQPKVIEQYCKEKKVTIASFTPALIAELNPDGFPHLRILDSSGEAANKEVLKRWLSNREVINTYGPTETTVNASSYSYTGDERKSVPIGKPITNTKFYVVDNEKLCGIGIPGELYIGGEGLARGYLNQPELTAQKFITNPFEKGKVYKTGDLVRWLSDGNIEYLGRIDEQIKIRGYRIELGEIDAVLRKVDHILDCAVIVKENGDNDKLIFGYFVSDTTINQIQLRQEMAKHLPDYMVPSALLQLEKIPVTPTGKLNKRMLPEITYQNNVRYRAPITYLERVVVHLFEAVLEQNNVSMNNNFFELGGHSLKAIRLLTRIYEEINVNVPLHILFQVSTIADLVSYIKEEQFKHYVPISIVEEKPYYETSSAEKRIYIMQQRYIDSISYNVPNMIQLNGNLNRKKLSNALENLIKRHECLRTHFEVVDGELVQIIKSNQSIIIEELQTQGQSVLDVIKSFIRPFDLSNAPLLRMGVLNVAENEHILLFDIHHIIFDGVSSDILIRDFARFYNGEELVPLHLQYKDFAAWQNVILKSEKMLQKEEYWLKKYNDRPENLRLFYDYKNPDLNDTNGAIYEFLLSENLADQLRDYGNQNKITLYSILLSAYSIMLSKYSDSEDIIIGSPYAGREYPGLEQIIGMFVNMLPMRTAPQSEIRYCDFLKTLNEEVFDKPQCA
jgi:amino acid adenylation domain-containing protein